MGHRVSKRDTLQSNILSGHWSFGESLGEVLREPELLIVGVRCHLQGEEGSVSALMDVNKNTCVKGSSINDVMALEGRGSRILLRQH